MAIAVANRYARALADVVARTANYRAVQSELESFSAAYRQSADLREVFETPAVGLPQKLKVLGTILGRLKVSTVTSNFLHVLAAHYRMGLLEEIRQAFARIVNERLGIVQVKVISAGELSQAEQKALRERFEEITRKKVELEVHRDEKLLGGIRAEIESTVYDGSIRSHLERIRLQLTSR